MAVATAVIMVGVVVVAVGRGGEMAYFTSDYAPLDLRVVAATDVVLLRPPTSIWGYNIQVTDEALSRITRALSQRDIRIASLEQQVADLRAERDQCAGGRSGPGAGTDASAARWEARPAGWEAATAGTRPGVSDTRPGVGGTRPGLGDTRPGVSDTRPGLGDTPPGAAAPGAGGTRPGIAGLTSQGPVPATRPHPAVGGPHAPAAETENGSRRLDGPGEPGTDEDGAAADE